MCVYVWTLDSHKGRSSFVKCVHMCASFNDPNVKAIQTFHQLNHTFIQIRNNCKERGKFASNPWLACYFAISPFLTLVLGCNTVKHHLIKKKRNTTAGKKLTERGRNNEILWTIYGILLNFTICFTLLRNKSDLVPNAT